MHDTRIVRRSTLDKRKLGHDLPHMNGLRSCKVEKPVIRWLDLPFTQSDAEGAHRYVGVIIIG